MVPRKYLLYHAQEKGNIVQYLLGIYSSSHKLARWQLNTLYAVFLRLKFAH